MFIFFKVFFLLSFLFFCYKRFLVLIHLFQQEEYDNVRYFKYIYKNHNLVDKKLSSILASLIILQVFIIFFDFSKQFLLSVLAALALIIFGFIQYNPLTKDAKKQLVFTKRVSRLLVTFLLILFLAITPFFYADFAYNSILLVFYAIVIIQILPIFLILANIFLSPYEKLTQKRFLNSAKRKIRQLAPQTIAITGSYGKTSTKHILNHILSFVAPTLCTPGSVNTPMGITRIIREKLTKDHKYFIVEMGAYGIGSISRLCDLTPPNYGIITAVGNAHYERFKSIDNVAQAKFELNQAVNENDGLTYVNSDSVNQNYIKRYGRNFILVGQDKDSDNQYKVSQVKLLTSGLQFKIKYKRNSYLINSPLYGLHHVNNIALCFALCHQIGIAEDTIISALNSLPQIKHRLEIINNDHGPIIIDDSYNSNPDGFKSALDVLKLLKQKNGRSILVTPGMVELGDLHDEKHSELAKKALETVDVVLVIMPNRIPTFYSTFRDAMSDKQQLLNFENFADAKKWIDANANAKDVILYENDLPDLYENKIKF